MEKCSMNALYELIGNSVTKEELSSIQSCTYTIIKDKYLIVPKFNTVFVTDWIKSIKWAYILCGDTEVILHSSRIKEDEEAFYNSLFNIWYDSGYGLQFLYGVIVFTNNTWLERKEYDGKEWWVERKMPDEQNICTNGKKIFNPFF